MDSAQSSSPLAAWAPPRSIAFKDWQARIEMPRDLDQLLDIVRRYLEQWTHEDLRELPLDLAVTALQSSEDLMPRAVMASREELGRCGDDRRNYLLRQMTLTYTSAAIRRAQLVALRSRKL
jgi:hypothetical protein